MPCRAKRMRPGNEAAGQIPEQFAASHRAHGWSEHAALAGELLGDDPVGITEAIKAAVCAGAPLPPILAGRSLTGPRSG